MVLHAHLPGLEDDRIRLLRKADYDRLVALGAFADERVELIRGLIIRMSPHGPSHASSIQRLTRLLTPPLVGRAEVRVQLPLNAPDESEPEPDIAVVGVGDYDDAHPSTALLIVEVADTSLVYDRATKGPLYAAMGVPEYWIVNVRDAVVEVHADPLNQHYGTVRTYHRGDAITLTQFPDVTIDIAAILRPKNN